MPIKAEKADDNFLLESVIKLSEKCPDQQLENQDYVVKLCKQEERPLSAVQHKSTQFLLVGRRGDKIHDVSNNTHSSTSTLEESSEDLDGSSKQQVEPEVVILPMATSEARWLVSAYNKLAKDQSLLPLWISCHGELAYLICEHDESLKVTTVKKRGPVSADTVDSLTSVVSRHSWGLEGYQVTKEGFARLDILENTAITATVSADETAIHGYEGGLYAEFTWDPVLSILQTPPMDSRAILHATPSCGDSRSPFYNFHEELYRIQCLIDGVTEGVIRWPAAESEESVVHRINKLFQEVESGDEISQSDINESQEDVDAKLQTAALVVDERVDLDFTESLWQILKDCTSYSQLVGGLQHTFNVLNMGQIKPMVHSNNKTTMARLVCDSYTNKMVVPNLTETVPLKIVAEMGLQKVTGDFVHIFLSHEWASLQHLEPFLSEDVAEMKKRFAHLQKLEVTLELVALLKLYLNLPLRELYQATRQALTYFSRKDCQINHTFSLPVNTSLLTGVIQSCTPREWHLCLKSADTETTYQLCKSTEVGYSTDSVVAETETTNENYDVTVATTSILPGTA